MEPGGANAGWFIAAAAAGLASILASVNARAVVPKLARWGVLHAKLDQARDAVAAVFDLRTENSAAVSHKKVLEAAGLPFSGGGPICLIRYWL